MVITQKMFVMVMMVQLCARWQHVSSSSLMSSCGTDILYGGVHARQSALAIS